MVRVDCIFCILSKSRVTLVVIRDSQQYGHYDYLRPHPIVEIASDAHADIHDQCLALQELTAVINILLIRVGHPS
jgi:hypothetical protein